MSPIVPTPHRMVRKPQLIKVTVALGSSKTDSTSDSRAVQQQGITLTAGNTLKPQQGNAASTTKSAIGDGAIVITDTAGQQQKTGQTADQTIASLNRDTANANPAIDKIFDLKKIQREQEVAKATSQLAQLAAPLLYEKVGDYLKSNDANTPTKVAVHALIGGLMSNAMGGEFGTGAAGAAAAKLAVETFGKDIDQIEGLSKQDKSALTQLLGLTVAKATTQIAGGTSTDGNASGVNAKLATEFNYLKHTDAAAMKKDIDSCKAKSNGCKDGEVIDIVKKYKAVSDTNIAAIDSCISAGNVQCVQDNLAQAASINEIKVLPFGYTQLENTFIGRQDNVNSYGSTKGNASMFGSDIEQARDVAGFRQDNCGGMSGSACDGLVKQAMDYRLGRMAILAATGAATGVAVRTVRGLKLPPTGDRSAAKKVSPTTDLYELEIAAKRDVFAPNGFKLAEGTLQKNPTAIAMLNEYKKALPNNYALAERLTIQALESGNAVPVRRMLSVGEELVRFTPVTDGPIPVSSYYMTRAQFDAIKNLSIGKISDKLGLPATSSLKGEISGFEAVSIKATNKINVFESTIAPAGQGTYHADGGLQQIIVPNTKDSFTAQSKISCCGK